MEQIKDKIDIKKIIFKIILYIAFLWVLYPTLLFLPTLPLDIMYYINENIPKIFLDNTSLLHNLIVFYIPLLFSPFICYIVAKLFGIFKFIDSLNICIGSKIIILIFISCFSLIILFLRFIFIDNNSNVISLIHSMNIFGLIPAFFLYKYFQYLTKKFPIPFKKIGYYTSIEFFKDLFRKLFKQN